MKKLLAIMLAMVMVFTMAGCGGKEEAKPAAKAEKQSEVQKII